MNEILNKYKKNSSYSITNQPNTDIVKKYMQLGNNRLDYYNQERAKAQQGINALSQQKFSSPEMQALEQNKAFGQFYNADNAFNQAQSIYQNQAQAMADLGVAKEQSEKYLPNQLQQAGMGNVGTSESSLIGIQNQYARGIGGVNQQASKYLNELQQNYANQNLSMEQAYLSDVNREKQNQLAIRQEQANNLLANATTLKDIDIIRQKYGDLLNDDYSKMILDKHTQEIAVNDMVTEFAKASNTSEYQTILNKYKKYLSEDDYTTMQNAITEQARQENLQMYGVAPDTQGIPMKQATPTSFGEFESVGGKQNAWVNDVIIKAKKGQIPNGTVIDFNYGIGTSKYIYIDGAFYKTDKKVTKGWKKP